MMNKVCLTSGVLRDRDEWFGGWIEVFNAHILADKFYVVIKSYYATIWGSFDIFLANIARLVIKETMRITAPSDTSHIYSK